MSDYDYIRTDVEDNVGTITLDQPDKRNPLGFETSEEVIDALETFDRNDEVVCIVITGAGNAFSAGGDIEEFSDAMEKPALQHLEEGDTSVELYKKVTDIKTPLIASVNGHALGGGIGMVAATDVAIASDEAKFGTPEITLGLFPLVIMPLLQRAVGYKNTMDLALTGRIIDAEEARDMGFVSRVVPDDELEDVTREMAESIASKSPAALNIGKRAFYGTMDMELDKALDFASSLRVTTWDTEDLKEGTEAFLEDREPEWKGR
ncbi:MAG: enoyl-CoA hydratase/isomerase family protein [bacterium]